MCLRSLAPFALLALVAPTLSACEGDPRATLRIVSVALSRDGEAKLVADVDLAANEAGGGNIGYYCVAVQFPGEPDFVESCPSVPDLVDGDTKSVHFVSTFVNGVGFVRVRAWVGQAETGKLDILVKD